MSRRSVMLAAAEVADAITGAYGSVILWSICLISLVVIATNVLYLYFSR